MLAIAVIIIITIVIIIVVIFVAMVSRINNRQCDREKHLKSQRERGTQIRESVFAQSAAKLRVEKDQNNLPSEFLATDFQSKKLSVGILQCGAVMLTAGQSSISSVAEKATGPRHLPSGLEPGFPQAWSWPWKSLNGKPQNRKLPRAHSNGLDPTASML